MATLARIRRKEESVTTEIAKATATNVMIATMITMIEATVVETVEVDEAATVEEDETANAPIVNGFAMVAAMVPTTLMIAEVHTRLIPMDPVPATAAGIRTMVANRLC